MRSPWARPGSSARIRRAGRQRGWCPSEQLRTKANCNHTCNRVAFGTQVWHAVARAPPGLSSSTRPRSPYCRFQVARQRGSTGYGFPPPLPCTTPWDAAHRRDIRGFLIRCPCSARLLREASYLSGSQRSLARVLSAYERPACSHAGLVPQDEPVWETPASGQRVLLLNPRRA